MDEKRVNLPEIFHKVGAGQLNAAQAFAIIRNRPAPPVVPDKAYRTVYFQDTWQQQPVGEPGVAGGVWGNLLILGDDYRLVDAYQANKPGGRAILVKPATAYQRLNEIEYTINPTAPDDYHKLVSDLLARSLLPTDVVHLWSQENLATETVSRPGAKEIFSLLLLTQAFMKHHQPSLRLLYLYPGTEGATQPQHAGVAGFARTIIQENRNFLIKTIELDPGIAIETLWAIVQAEFSAPSQALQIRYRNKVRWVQGLARVEVPKPQVATPLLRDGGVYLITGGAGGLGLIFAEYLARHSQTKIILTGRSAVSPATTETIQRLSSLLGATIRYLPADITDREQTQRLIRQIKEEWGEIHGIIHSAGITQDSLLINKSLAAMQAVLAPKVDGTLVLDEMTREERLDFFILFSSLAAATGNVGQCDYAYANAFLDYFAIRREELRKQQRRFGQTVSIGWAPWQEGRMALDAPTRNWLQEKAGIVPFDARAGQAALAQCWQLATSHIIAVYGLEHKITEALLGDRGLATAAKLAPRENQEPLPYQLADSGRQRTILQDKAQDYLRKLIAQELHLSPARIIVDEPLDKYGLDSVMVVNLTRKMENDFGELSKTLFFQYQRITELAQYLVQNYRRQLLQMVDISATAEPRPHVPVPEMAVAPVTSVPATQPVPVHDLPATPSLSSTTRALARPVTETEIAVIGLSGRYPQAKNLREFWENLAQGKDCITEIPQDRWDVAKYYRSEKDVPGTSYLKWGGFLDDVDKFDPCFFQITPREAEVMDPQERLFLETAWATIEDAGYTRSALQRRKVGVFVGVMYGEYQLVGIGNGQAMGLASSYASVANRVSYYFNWHGPSMALDTMCSSSLTAIHLACESIRRGECELALAGGVNVSIHPNKYITLAQGKFAASDGRCHSFGEGGDGYTPAEGVGAVLLKPLPQAISDQDHIYAIIKASALNHGGKTNGYTVPNPNAQAEVIREALAKAAVDPRTIGYVEAHGTGTALGDPIEITGLIHGFDLHSQEQRHCAIGSVKSNIGHAEAAAGIAGLTKIILQMQHKKLVPSLHAEKLNPNIRWEATPFYVQRELAAWKQPVITQGGAETVYPRRAGLSSFGAGGANAHLVIEEYLPASEMTLSATPAVTPPAAVAYLLPLSVKNEQALPLAAAQLREYLLQEPADQVSLAAIAGTLQLAREPMPHRLAIIAATRQELIEKLTSYLNRQGSVPDVYVDNAEERNNPGRLLLEGRAGQEFVKLLMDGKDLGRLAQAWVSGIEIDWHWLYPAAKPAKISLPSYPFVRQRYWVTAGLPPHASVSAQATTTRRILEKCWREPPAKPTNLPPIAGNVVVLVNQQTAPLARQILPKPSSGKIFIVQQATSYSKTADNRYRCDLAKSAHGKKLATALAQQGEINYCIDLSDFADKTIRTGKGISGKIALCQELIRNAGSELTLLHFTQGLQTFQTTEPTLAGAKFAGFAKMLSAEYSRVNAKTIDTDTSPQELAQIVASELAGNDLEREICYRHGKRYVPYLASIPLPRLEQPTSRLGNIAIAPDKVIVVTGGTRGLGLEVAKYLVTKGARKLVLMGLQKLPPAAEWQKTIENPQAERTLVAKLKEIGNLKARGTIVELYAGPLTQKRKLSLFLQKIRKKMGAIGGVIHCAGLALANNPAFIHKESADIEAVLSPKVRGLELLHELVGDDDLDFFILFSSVSAWIPVLGTGLSDYAAANAFMNYFADYQCRQGKTCYRSLVWPNWQDSGMGQSDNPRYRSLGLTALSTHDGLSLLDSAMGIAGKPCLLPCVVASDQFFPETWLQVKLPPPAPISSTPVPAATPPITPAVVPPLWQTMQTEEPVATYTRQWLGQLFTKTLKIPENQLDRQAAFGDFGVDSVLLAEISKQIEVWLGEKLNPTTLVEHTTLNRLSHYLSQTFAEKIRARMPVNAALSASESVFRPVPVAPPITVVSGQEPERQATLPKSDKAVAPIAIVGLACRFPGGEDRESFWQSLAKGVCSIREVPPSRWDVGKIYAPRHEPGKSISKWGGFLADIDTGDVDVFRGKPEAAQQMHPQERLFFEESVKAIWDAGYSKESIGKRRVGVFAGARANLDLRRGNDFNHAGLTMLGPNFIAARVSYHFDFQGPSLAIDTACSSALVAMHYALKSLRDGEIDYALVGGINLLLNDIPYLALSAAHLLSPTGQCLPFDGSANGFVPGEGVGVVLLRPLAQALAAGNHIYAVILDSAVNNNGKSLSITTANKEAQIDLLTSAWNIPGFDPSSLSYIETNGTGTVIGDLLELKAIASALACHGSSNSCSLGSVKKNIGHLLSAAGMASFIKVVLSLHHKQIPPLNCQHPTADFDFQKSQFCLDDKARVWKSPQGVRRAGINSFGDGGTNCHMVLEEFVPPYGYQVAGKAGKKPRQRQKTASVPKTTRPLPKGVAVDSIWKLTNSEDLHHGE